MEHTLRITPEQTIENYKKSGLKPCTGFLRSRNNNGCGLGAYLIASGVSVPDFIGGNQYPIYKLLQEQFGEEYMEGFIVGFDHGNLAGWKDKAYTEPRRQQGFEDGKASAVAVSVKEWEKKRRMGID